MTLINATLREPQGDIYILHFLLILSKIKKPRLGGFEDLLALYSNLRKW